MSRRATPLLALAITAGCHLASPYSASRSADARLAPPADAVLNAHDALPGDLAAADLPAPDLPAPDLAAADLGATCVEQQPIAAAAATCAEQQPDCVGAIPPPDDADCDGLVRDADPAPDSCNPLRLFDGFDSDPAARWVPAGAYSWSCGQLDLSPPATVQLAAARSGTLGLGPIAQLRFRYLQDPSVGPHEVSLGINLTGAGTGGVRCRITHDGTYPKLGTLTNGLSSIGVSVSPAKDAPLLLQVWLEGAKP